MHTKLKNIGVYQCTSAVKYIWIAALFILLAPALSYAQDETVDTAPPPAASAANIYSPDYCEFSVAFPEPPYLSNRCQGDSCFDVTSFTQVFDMSATVNYRVACNPLSDGVYEQYSPEIMETTLQALTKDSLTKLVNSNFREDEEKRYKQASVVGEGTVGRSQAIYIAQMWLGKHSAMTVEAELIGEQNPAADKLYSDILKTIHYSGVKSAEASADVKPQNP